MIQDLLDIVKKLAIALKDLKMQVDGVQISKDLCPCQQEKIKKAKSPTPSTPGSDLSEYKNPLVLADSQPITIKGPIPR
eukprot:UN18680